MNVSVTQRLRPFGIPTIRPDERQLYAVAAGGESYVDALERTIEELEGGKGASEVAALRYTVKKLERRCAQLAAQAKSAKHSRDWYRGRLADALLALATRPLPPADPAPHTSGVLTLNHSHLTVSLNGRSARLTPTEFRIAELLAATRGHPVPRPDLARAVWPDDEVSTHRLWVNLSRLRLRLEAVGARDRLVGIPGVGYTLVAAPPTDEAAG